MKKIFFRLIIIFLFSTTLIITKEISADIKVGVSKIDITPPVGTPLGGYGARSGNPSIGIHDPIEVRAIVISDRVEKIAIVSCDLLLIYSKMMDIIREKVKKETDIKEDRIFIFATHTHSGPGAYWASAKIVLGQFDRKIRDFLCDGIAKAIVSANFDLKPVIIEVGKGSVFASVNRTKTYKPSSLYGKYGITDPEVLVIKFSDLKGQVLSTIINYATHPTVLSSENYLFSADFPYYLRKKIDEKYKGSITLYINGAMGDQSPKGELEGISGFEQAELVGNLIADAVEKVKLKILKNPKIKISSQIFNLPDVGKNEMHTISFNDTLIVTIPGELFSLFGQQIKKKAKEYGFKNVLIGGLCNTYLGYIMTEEAYNHIPWEYERTFCFTGPKGGEFILNTSEKLMKELRSN